MAVGSLENRSLLKPVLAVAAVTVLLLLVPLTAMQFTDEVRWGPGDFLVAGCLLWVTGTGIVLVARNTKHKGQRVALIGLLLLALAIVWADLAVGIFH